MTIKTILCTLLIAALSLLLFASYLTYRNQVVSYNKNLTNHVLYDVDSLMELLSHTLKQPCSLDSINHVRRGLESIVKNKIITIASIKPQIETLEGIPLKGLEKVVKYIKNTGFITNASNNEINALDSIVLDYVRTIEKKVLEESKKRSEFTGILKESERKKLGLP